VPGTGRKEERWAQVKGRNDFSLFQSLVPPSLFVGFPVMSAPDYSFFDLTIELAALLLAKTRFKDGRTNLLESPRMAQVASGSYL
jgi:hypothetical protein